MCKTDQEDNNYRRCKNCGVLVRIDREQFNGKMNVGLDSETITYDSYDYPTGSASRNIYLPVIASGCWFCGNSDPQRLKKV